MAYEIEVRHRGLQKYRVVRAPTAWEAQAKAEAQLRAWEEQWQRKLAVKERRGERQAAQEYKEARKAEAGEITAEAAALRDELEGILAHTLRVNDAIDWSEFLDRREFPEPMPARPMPPEKPVKPQLRLPPREPKKPGLLRRVFEALDSGYEEDRLEMEEEDYQSRVAEGKRAYREEVARYNRAVESYNETVRRDHAEWIQVIAQWERRRAEFLAAQKAHNLQVADFARRYQSADPQVVSEYCELVLQRSQYPDLFPGDFDIRFIPQSGTLVVDFGLPTPDRIPPVKSARYVASRDAIETKDYTATEKARLYEQVVYQTALRTIHELYEADRAVALRSIVFNGCTRSISPVTGNEVFACILSVQASREEFLAIDLSRVGPKKCLGGLGCVAAKKLHELTPVTPVLALNSQAPPLIEGRELLDGGAEADALVVRDPKALAEPAPGPRHPPGDTSPTSISCPACGASFRLSSDLRGKHVRCGSCRRKFHVPW